MMVKRLFLFLAFMMLCAATRAQSSDAMDSIVKHVAYYNAQKSNTTMFVHVDKTVYVNNEMMWFTAYMLWINPGDTEKHQVLSVALVNNNNQVVAVQGRFAMGGGLAFGNLMIPDTIPPGHYSFIAYTNLMVNGKPDAYFVQSITLKTASQPAFNVELTLDTLYKDPINTRVMVQVNSKTGPLDGAAINYYLGKDLKTRITGKAKTNVIGSYTLLIPKDHINTAQHNLEVDVKSGTDTKTLHLDIPVKKQVADVKFYPEGGHLVLGMPNHLGWEVKTTGGTAIKTTAVLYAGKEMIDTISTDSYGMGTVNLLPTENTTYSIKLLDYPDSQPVYILPAAINAAVVMHIPDAIAKDTMLLMLQSKAQHKYVLLIHNYKKVYSATSFYSSARGSKVKVDLTGIPRGLQTATLLDSLYRPVAERLFFAHYDRKQALSIAIDDKEPTNRQKINLKLKLNGTTGKALHGIVSVACVQDNRLEAKNDNNIEYFVYLRNELESIPLKDNLMGSTEVDHRYLNELLLVRGWSKYNWPEMMQADSSHQQGAQDSLQFTANITHFTQPVKQPVEVIMMKDTTGIDLFKSNVTGGITLSNGDVYVGPDKQVRLIVSGKSDEYVIKVNDPYISENTVLAKSIEPVAFEEPLKQNTTEFVLNGFEHATHLREVIIKAATDKAMYGPRANACGDYVCRFHILNCSNHRDDPGNRAPIPGEMVNIPGLGKSSYVGCDLAALQPGMVSFKGVYSSKEYYGADYSFSNPTEPDYLSTLCWKHSVHINSDNEANISFYTSDITGKFRIVVQGITNEDVIYGEDSFVVKKKAVQ